MEFKGEYSYLKNTYNSAIIIKQEDLLRYSDNKLHDYIRDYLPNGFQFSSVEHAFQAFRVKEVYDFVELLNTSNGYECKQLGKGIKARDKWSVYRDEVMAFLVTEKFKQNFALRDKLLNIVDTIHFDTPYKEYYWGRVIGENKGQDKLGKILRDVKKELTQIRDEKLDNSDKKATFGSFLLKDAYKQTVVDFLSLVKDNVFFIVDTETTGLDERFWDAIEVSALKVDGNSFEIIEEFDTFINPGYKLPNSILEFNKKNETGIDDELLSTAPKSKEGAVLTKEFLGDNPIIMGQNIGFDIKFINKLYKQNLKQTFNYAYVIDTLKMAKERIPGSHKLGDLYAMIPNAPAMTFHKSIDDVKATLEVFKWLTKEYGINIERNNFNMER